MDGSSLSLEAENRRVLKGWSGVVDALGKGLQTILIRKYSPAHTEFFLYPTYGFSTRKDYLGRYFQERYHDFVRKSVESKKEGKSEIQYYAVLTETVKVKLSVTIDKEINAWLERVRKEKQMEKLERTGKLVNITFSGNLNETLHKAMEAGIK